MADRVGQQLGNYRLLRLLGQGGFAEVYLGEHIYLETQAAIKVLHAQVESDNEEHFRTEARTIARLIHPNIVRVLEFGVEGTTPFLVVDYAPNGTLRKRHPRGSKLPLITIVGYVSQLADALQYAHDQKIVHRDVKPENMLVGRRNEVLLSDFGIAVITQSTHHHSTQGIQDLAGTVAYMAPEQIQSQAVPASDQYSLAIAAYEWICGERPFHGTLTEIAVKHAVAIPPPLGEKAPSITSEVEAVINKALSKDPKQRYACINDFAQALEEAVASIESPSATTELTSSTRSLTPPQSILPQAGPELVLAPPSPTPHTAPLDEHPLIADEINELRSTTTVPLEEVIATPSSSMVDPITPIPVALQAEEATPAVAQPEEDVLEAVQAEKAEPVRQWLEPLHRRTILLRATAAVTGIGALALVSWAIYEQANNHTTPTPTTPPLSYTYSGHSDAVWSVAWSPNGKYIASAGSDKMVQVWDASNGNPLYTYQGHTDTVYSLSWSPDSTRIASASYDRTVQVWDALDGFYPATYNGHTAWVWVVAWSPDGAHIASAGDDKTVRVWRASDTETVNTYYGHRGFVSALAWSPDSKHLVSGGSDGTAQVWQASSDSTSLFTYLLPATTIWSATWSPNGRRIALACDDKTVHVWDALSGDNPYIYRQHTDFVYAVAWSPNGKMIASGGDDRTVRVWEDFYGDNPPHVYREHMDAVRVVSWSPDSTHVASGSRDRTVQVWRAI